MIRIHAHSSRQPLVKGERLVRYEVSAAMIYYSGDRIRLLHLVIRIGFYIRISESLAAPLANR